MTTDQSAKSNCPVLSNEDPARYEQLLNEVRTPQQRCRHRRRPDALVVRYWELALAGEANSSEHTAIHRFNRQIDQLHNRIARLERRLKFIRSNFPQEAPARSGRKRASILNTASGTATIAAATPERRLRREHRRNRERHWPRRRDRLLPS